MELSVELVRDSCAAADEMLVQAGDVMTAMQKHLQHLANARPDQLHELRTQARRCASELEGVVSKWPKLRTLIGGVFEALEGYVQRDETAQPVQ